MKFHGNPFNGSRVVPCGQTDGGTDGRADRHDNANSRFSNGSHPDVSRNYLNRIVSVKHNLI